jgi:hypothetical protein
MEIVATPDREQLLTSGYCIVRDVLDQPMLDELRHVTDGLLEQQSQADRARYRYQGSKIAVAYPLIPYYEQA